VHLMFLAELAIELLGLWMMHHFYKGRPNRRQLAISL
jgi:hypothetical protein